MFADKGYEKATVREICRAAGVNVAAINYYFGDKQQLYIRTVQQAYENRAASVPMPTWDSQHTAAEQLRGFIHTLVARMVGLDQAPWQTRLLMREVMSPTGACQTLVEEYIRPHLELLLEILDKMLPAEITETRRLKIAFSIIGQCQFYRVSGGIVSLLMHDDQLQRHFSVHELAEHIADTCLASLAQLPDHWHAEQEPAQRTHLEPAETLPIHDPVSHNHDRTLVS